MERDFSAKELNELAGNPAETFEADHEEDCKCGECLEEIAANAGYVNGVEVW